MTYQIMHRLEEQVLITACEAIATLNRFEETKQPAQRMFYTLASRSQAQRERELAEVAAELTAEEVGP